MNHLLPLDNVNNCEYAEKFLTAYDQWHEHENLFQEKHPLPLCFYAHKFPVFSITDSVDVINNNNSRIKFFIRTYEFGVHWFFQYFETWQCPDHLSSLQDLQSDCLYVFITGDDFCAEDYPLYNRQGERLNYLNVYFPWFIYWLTPIDFFDPMYSFSQDENSKFFNFDNEKPVDFLVLIGRNRTERLYLVQKITEKTPEKNYALKLDYQDGKFFGNKEIWKKDFAIEKQNEDFTFVTMYNRSKALSHKISRLLGPRVPLDLFNQAKISIIAETQIIHDSVDNFFVTEKTTKALFTGMPFIMYGSKNFLANLRKLGFMTYNSLWSEDYDLLPTYQERADAIVALMQDLLNFDWETAIPELERIHYHNLQMLANRHEIISNSFIELDLQLEKLIADSKWQ